MSNSSLPSYPTDQPVNESSWRVIWFNALRRPFLSTFEEFLRDPNISTRRAYTWVIVSALISSLLVVLNPYGNSKLTAKAPIGILINSMLFVVVFLLWTGLLQFVARILNGSGTYSKLAYAIACFHAPLTIIRALVVTTPILQAVLVVFSLYLAAVATKATHRFSWVKTVVITTSTFIVIFLLILAMVILYAYINVASRSTPSLLGG